MGRAEAAAVVEAVPWVAACRALVGPWPAAGPALGALAVPAPPDRGVLQVARVLAVVASVAVAAGACLAAVVGEVALAAEVAARRRRAPARLRFDWRFLRTASVC